tara:strand:+ start:323895 stop:325127 length:1233 start_codon:yes stop_codon:yes gene_type:complete
MSDNKDKKEPELADIAANFVRDKNKRQKIFNGVGYIADTAVKLFTGLVYIGSAIWNFGEKIAPSVGSTIGKTKDFALNQTKSWRGNLANNFSENDEFGNSKFKWPTGIKQWHQVATPPAMFFVLASTVYGVAAAGLSFPRVWLADSKPDPIYLVNKPQAKNIAGESEWTVSCAYLAEQSEEDANCTFALPDNGYLDLAYRLKSIQLNPIKTISGIMTGYSPRAHAAQSMLGEDSQYCAINTTFEKPMFGAEQNLPSLYRSPICDPNLDTLVEKLENDQISKNGEILRKAGTVEKKSDGSMFYRPADEASWLSGAFAWTLVQGGEAIDAVSDTVGGWVDSAFEESKEEVPSENQENESKDAEDKPHNPKTEGKTSMTDFISASYNNDNYKQSDMVVNVHFDKTVLPAMKIA